MLQITDKFVDFNNLGAAVAPGTGLSVVASPQTLPLLAKNGSGFSEARSPARRPAAVSSTDGSYTLYLPWPSESDPACAWLIRMPDGVLWLLQAVPEGVNGPFTIKQLKDSYGLLLVNAARTQHVLGVQGPPGLGVSTLGSATLGDHTVSGSETATGPRAYHDLTIGASGVLNMMGYPLFVRGTLTNLNSGNGLISQDPVNAGSAGDAGAVGGASGSPGSSTDLGIMPSSSGASGGGYGQTADGQPGTDATGFSDILVGVGMSIRSSSGGASGNGGGYTGAAGGQGELTPENGLLHLMGLELTYAMFLSFGKGAGAFTGVGGAGGAGGAGDGVHFGGGGGGGGSSGPGLAVWAHKIDNRGTFSSIGGSGGPGGAGDPAGNTGGGGGGAGGSGGVTQVVCDQFINRGSYASAGGSGGAGGFTGGTGTNGSAGQAGRAGYVLVVEVSTGSVTETAPGT